MTAITKPGPLGTVLSILARAGRSRHVLYTLAPDEIRPPRINIELASSAEVQHFAAAVQSLIDAAPAAGLDHLAIVLDEVTARALARWNDPRAEGDPWYHSRAVRHAIDAAITQGIKSPHRRSALAQAAACALVAIADWDRHNAPGEAGEVVSACADGLVPAPDDVLQAYQPVGEQALESFVGAWCERCRKDSTVEPCAVFTSGLLYTPVDTAHYPPEWVSGAAGANPRCTAFVAKEEAHV